MLNKSSEKCGHNNDFVLNSSGSITKCKLVRKLPLLGHYNVFWKGVILKNRMNSIKLSHTRDSRLQMCALRSNYLYFSKLTPPPPSTICKTGPLLKLVPKSFLYQLTKCNHTFSRKHLSCFFTNSCISSSYYNRFAIYSIISLIFTTT